MMEPGKGHYDARYFTWQRTIGEFGGRANLFKFRPFIKSSDRVLEFGCGGGYLLSNLECRERAGIEVNPAAIAQAESRGIVCYSRTADVADGWADVVISHSALEHVARPLDELTSLRRKLRAGGLAVFFVPCESRDWKYQPDDINQHLYTWSPMSLGNLFSTAGFEVTNVDVLRQAWPPGSPRIYGLVGESGFRVVARVSWFIRQLLAFAKPMKIAAGLRIVAVNPANSAGPSRGAASG